MTHRLPHPLPGRMHARTKEKLTHLVAALSVLGFLMATLTFTAFA